MPPTIDQEPAGGLNPVNISALANGTLTWFTCMSGVSRLGSLFQKNVAADALLCGASGF
jgi:hypothetical protein